jgi:predicted dienelactone hydrolase
MKRSMSRTARALALVLSLGQPALADQPDDYPVPEHLFAAQVRGPYQTGTFEELWIDTQREDSTTSDPADKRRLMVQIWYPATFKGDPPRAPYALSRELYANDARQSWLERAKAVRTTSVLRAPLATQLRRFPILIYNPGAGYPPFSATYQTEFLASHGYVVVAVGHSDVSRVERFPDGSTYQRDRNVPRVTDEQRQSLSAVDELWLWVGLISEFETKLHVRDISFVLDRLEAMNRSRGGIFYRRLDFERVGSLGWSLGGAASLEASRDEPRIKAAANFDGRLYTDAANTGTHRPILQMHGDRKRVEHPTPAEREVMLVGDSLFWRMFSKTDADWYDLTLQGATHEHFADLTLLAPPNPQLMHPQLAHDITNAYTLEFFDRYLRGRTDTPLLSGSKGYPDARLIRNRVE